MLPAGRAVPRHGAGGSIRRTPARTQSRPEEGNGLIVVRGRSGLVHRPWSPGRGAADFACQLANPGVQPNSSFLRVERPPGAGRGLVWSCGVTVSYQGGGRFERAARRRRRWPPGPPAPPPRRPGAGGRGLLHTVPRTPRSCSPVRGPRFDGGVRRRGGRHPVILDKATGTVSGPPAGPVARAQAAWDRCLATHGARSLHAWCGNCSRGRPAFPPRGRRRHFLPAQHGTSSTGSARSSHAPRPARALPGRRRHGRRQPHRAAWSRPVWRRPSPPRTGHCQLEPRPRATALARLAAACGPRPAKSPSMPPMCRRTAPPRDRLDQAAWTLHQHSRLRQARGPVCGGADPLRGRVAGGPERRLAPAGCPGARARPTPRPNPGGPVVARGDLGPPAKPPRAAISPRCRRGPGVNDGARSPR